MSKKRMDITKKFFVKLGRLYIGGRRPPSIPKNLVTAEDRIYVLTGNSSRALPFGRKEDALEYAKHLGGEIVLGSELVRSTWF